MGASAIWRHRPICERMHSKEKLQEMYDEGWSVRELADDCKVSRSAIRRVVNAHRGAGGNHKAKIAELRGIEEIPKEYEAGERCKAKGCGILIFKNPSSRQTREGQRNHRGKCAICAGKMGKDYHALYGVGMVGSHKPRVAFVGISWGGL